MATGTGFHSVRLLEEGFETVSADGSPHMLAKAFENGRKYGGHILRVVQADWRWLNRDVHGEYDAIICLGNSFTHLFSERDRRKALAEFYAMLKHDGVLIIDQRNYDAILDDGFSSTHKYYYCGEDVSAEPVYVDEGLVRFRYQFADGSDYYLNMFPLRKNYTRRLMREVGFQRMDTYGDFQATYNDGDPDFFIHVAEKLYRDEDERDGGYSSAVSTARDYYNSDDADNFYASIWGGEHIHIGIYESEEDSIDAASRRTVERIAGKIMLNGRTRVIDVGAGFGGAARYLARTYGCPVTCLNLSEKENERNRRMNHEQGLAHLIEVVDGSFEDIPFRDNAFDVVWSQDALLHSGDRVRVLEEIYRVLRKDGEVVFTDPMAADGATRESLRPILDRIHLDTMGTPEFYRRQANRVGLDVVEFDNLTHQLIAHYSRVLNETDRREAEISEVVSREYISRMRQGLSHWINGGNAGNLVWGIFHLRA